MIRTYRVFGISCDHCKQTIEAALGAVDGVYLVEVDVKKKTVRIGGDASEAAVRAAIVGTGYEIADVVGD